MQIKTQLKSTQSRKGVVVSSNIQKKRVFIDKNGNELSFEQWSKQNKR